MSFHNVRDKAGRFAPVTGLSPKKRNENRKKAKATVSGVINKNIINLFVLDDTGSMCGAKAQAVITGFNQIIQDLRKADIDSGTKTKELVSTFGDPGNYRKVMQVVDRLSGTWPEMVGTLRYTPNQGSTALYQAVVEAVKQLDREVADATPGTKVVLTVFTDGGENAAPQYQAEAKALVEDRNSKGWVINFMGAGDKMFVEQMSSSMGIYAANTMSFDNSASGVTKATRTYGTATTSYRGAVADGLDSNIGFFSND